jgi:NADH:ubiquinone reductase (H+-translocating)
MSALTYPPGAGVARRPAVREARGGTLVLGGGFGGAHVARLLGSATVVSPEGSLLYTPLLPEVAAGAVEPRHAFVPLRMMCPRAEVLRGHASALDQSARTVTVETETGSVVVSYRRLVIALGSTPRMPPIPGLGVHALTFKDMSDAIRLRDHVLRRLDLAEGDPRRAARQLTFVFVGAGYAGVEALAETRQLVQDALPHYPALRGARQRWVLVDAAPRILAEVPDRLSDYTSDQLRQDGVEILTSSRVASVDGSAVTLSTGRHIATATLVWATGVSAHPLVRAWGLPLDERGRVVVDSSLRVRGRPGIWALGDCAAVPNAATPGRFDPPTCQHAVRQARALVGSLDGETRPYRYRSIGEGATLGRGRGIARVFGLHVRGRLGALITRAYHVSAVPVRSRRLRILADGLLSTLFRRDIAELGTSGPTQGSEVRGSLRRAWRSAPTATR